MARPKKHSVDQMIAILNRIVEDPHCKMKITAKDFRLSPVSLYNWQARSAKDEAQDLKEESDFYFEWMQQTSYLHRHIVLAKRLSVLQIDSRLRSAALHNHRELLSNNQTGRPIWQVDPKLAADAQDPEMWELLHAPRPITDVYVREQGQLVQAYAERAPNAAVLIKAASSLLPEIYGERVEHNVQVGGVVRIGAEATPKQITASQSDFTVLADTPELVKPATNVLAVADKCESIEEFEEKFGGKRLVEGVLFFDTDGTLLPPQPQIVVVFGSSLHRSYSEAGIAVKTVSAEGLSGILCVRP